MQYIIIDRASGALVQYADDPPSQIALQAKPGQLAILFDHSNITREVDEGRTYLALAPEPVKAIMRDLIDREAGEFRMRFITDVPGQAQTYANKEAEARLWVEGDEAVHPARYPFMLAEAQVRGVPIASVRSEIMAQVNLLTPLAALI
jgi:hypothetical protein